MPHIPVQTANFYHQRIKVPRVLCQQHVQEFGDLTIPAPAGVVLDPETGELNLTVTLEQIGDPQVRTITVLPDKVVNQGVVTVALLVEGLVVIQSLEIPFQGIVECPGTMPGDHVQKHDFQVVGFSISPIQILVGDVLTLFLVLKAVVEMCVVITREEILKVNAANIFC